ncbi:hypothetical protein JRQ81_010070, partial [Phrynocephalus forsythii]
MTSSLPQLAGGVELGACEKEEEGIMAGAPFYQSHPFWMIYISRQQMNCERGQLR